MTRAGVRRSFAAIAIAAALARVLACRGAVGAIHPDEIFQAIEPAWWHLHGGGLLAWEWRPEVGIRSWVWPTCNGAVLALLDAVGITRGATLGAALQIATSLFSLLLVAAAYQGGAAVARAFARQPAAAANASGAEAPAGWQGGLLAALLCGLLPLLVQYAPHTLSETPSMLALVTALTLTARTLEQPEVSPARGLAIGALLATGACIRIANGPLVLVAPLWLLLRRRWALLGALAVGAAAVAVVFALVDLVTWGHLAGSFIGYVRFNFLQGKAADFGTAPWSWYAQRIASRAPIAIALVLVPLLLGARASWPFAVSALGLVALLSTQAHKEERFVIAFWPFALIGAAGVVGAQLAMAQDRSATPDRARWRGALAAAVLGGTVVLLADNARHPVAGDHTVARARMDAQAWAGDDPKATGLLIDRIFWSGGSTWFGRALPQMNFDPALLPNRLFSHVLTERGEEAERLARAAGFVPVFARAGVLLLRRP
jgi:phosphatidylinositol glycan class B